MAVNSKRYQDLQEKKKNGENQSGLIHKNSEYVFSFDLKIDK